MVGRSKALSPAEESSGIKSCKKGQNEGRRRKAKFIEGHGFNIKLVRRLIIASREGKLNLSIIVSFY